MKSNLTKTDLEVIAECIRMTASMILMQTEVRKVDKVRLMTIGVVLDKVLKEIEATDENSSSEQA